MNKTAFKVEPVTLSGNSLEVNDTAPQVKLVDVELNEQSVGGASGRKQLIVALPSVDTAVCALETRTFNQKISNLGTVDTFIVSMDLPFASARFCGAEGIERVTPVSDFRYREFGEKYGLLMKDGPLKGLIARAVFVVNENGTIVYKELVDDITHEPDYDKALAALK
jgi:thiol peroxidase